MMTREEMLERAEKWLMAGAGQPTEEMETRFMRIAEMWIRLAAEVRKGSAPASPDVN